MYDVYIYIYIYICIYIYIWIYIYICILIYRDIYICLYIHSLWCHQRSLYSAVCLSSRKRTSASSSTIWNFSFNDLSLFDDIELGDDTLECLLDFLDGTLPNSLEAFDFASAAFSLPETLIQPWIICLNYGMLPSVSWNQSFSCCSTGNKALYSLCTSVTILNRSSTYSICFLIISAFLGERSRSFTAFDF